MEAENLSLAQLRPIVFEGVPLPRSVMAISLLAAVAEARDRELAGWLASFPDCRANPRSAASLTCFLLAGRARDLMLDERETVLAQIEAHLGGFDPKGTYGEWITALQRVSELAAQTEDECEWFAPAVPGEAPIVSKQVAAMRSYLGGAE